MVTVWAHRLRKPVGWAITTEEFEMWGRGRKGVVAEMTEEKFCPSFAPRPGPILSIYLQNWMV